MSDFLGLYQVFSLAFLSLTKSSIARQLQSRFVNHVLLIEAETCGYYSFTVTFFPSGSVAANKSLIMHMLSQVRIGMDLTRVTLPTFILEKRSLLQMYAEFFAHPDIFVQ